MTNADPLALLSYESMADLNFLIPVDPSASQLDNDSVANDRRKGKPKQKIN